MIARPVRMAIFGSICPIERCVVRCMPINSCSLVTSAVVAATVVTDTVVAATVALTVASSILCVLRSLLYL